MECWAEEPEMDLMREKSRPLIFSRIILAHAYGSLRSIGDLHLLQLIKHPLQRLNIHQNRSPYLPLITDDHSALCPIARKISREIKAVFVEGLKVRIDDDGFESLGGVVKAEEEGGGGGGHDAWACAGRMRFGAISILQTTLADS